MNRKLTLVLALIVFLMMGMTAFALDFGGDSEIQVPEPSSIVVLSIGLAGVAYAAWRRNRKK